MNGREAGEKNGSEEGEKKESGRCSDGTGGIK